ncbi:MAG: protein-L-isoaspartate(D-aspartate) O-methyltransferase [Candidatus Promineifilaceae bacterium]|nr:protein-L-isoaspartate(D-aspartate) O-methyltransferase [Candidatus Promineifilaceae bacterium]
MNASETDMAQARQRMVAEQIVGRGIRDEAIIAAMAEVPRDAFVEPRYREFAYEDGPLPIPAEQTISQPYVVALMIQALELHPEDKVLEVGTGSGYAAAVLSRIVREVHTVERLKKLVAFARQNLATVGYDNVHVHHSDGTTGWARAAPYEAIVVAAGGPHVPEPLKAQLTIGGRLVIPIGSAPRAQQLVRVTRVGPDDYKERHLGHVRFVPLIGSEGWDRDSTRRRGFF